MSRKLLVAAMLVACLMAVFTTSVKITEEKNMNDLKKYYLNNSVENTDSNIVKIPPPSEQAKKYHQSRVNIWIIKLLWSIFVPMFFIFSRLSVGIRRWAQGRSRRIIVIIALYLSVYSLIEFLLFLPLDYYSEFIRMHAYGLSNQTFAKWFGDSVKDLIISTFINMPVVWAIYATIRRSSKYWWLYSGLLYIPFLFFMSFISPFFIDPVFNKYTALEDKALEAKIYDLIKRTAIEDCKVYQVNKSVDTNEMNACMTGVLGSKRIVLWDTTIKKLNDREILCVVAHEMGHYLMGHVWKSIFISGLLCVFILYFVNKGTLWLLDVSRGSFGFSRLHDIASLPLLALLVALITFILSPGINAYSRQMEMEADRFELELTQDNYASASAMVKLHEQSLSLPQPGLVYMLWNYDHPTFKSRVDFANTYKPWKENKPLKYRKFIK